MSYFGMNWGGMNMFEILILLLCSYVVMWDSCPGGYGSSLKHLKRHGYISEWFWCLNARAIPGYNADLFLVRGDGWRSCDEGCEA